MVCLFSYLLDGFFNIGRIGSGKIFREFGRLIYIFHQGTYWIIIQICLSRLRVAEMAGGGGEGGLK